MSGGITQLVAIGAQDAHLVGKPEVSFFRSNYKRHTNFSHVVERQTIQGNPANNGMSTVRFERKGDMLSYVYLSKSTANFIPGDIAKLELLIGGQIIDTQDYKYSTEIAPSTSASTYSRASVTPIQTYPIRFSFCENWQSALPLVALQYHDVEIRITWGTALTSPATFECWADFIYLDTIEREEMANKPQNLLITQVQKSLKSNQKMQEINFNHPVKYLATSLDLTANPTTSKVKLQVNGTDIGESKTVTPHFNNIPQTYHTQFTSTGTLVNIIPFCLDTNKLQPTGSLNFSRIDSARLVTDAAAGFNEVDVYGVNYNILRIQNGMGGLMYAN